MTKKRRNNGRSKKNRGLVRRIHCNLTGKLVPKDKAIVRYVIKNIVDLSSLRDLQDSCIYEYYTMPKLYYKNTFSIESAIHNRIVRVRSKADRKKRLLK
ncbi:40S ribosomal protein S26 [Guillardia theta]|uniref:40S ribosomal protein S26 n=1 Tax=Guillardia theta TaxID=55529 RepID=Q9AW37_GUITH|nr:40S ribosomal protein S26 [Guillardia theta]CAC27034.1 40S ribosomal protein S26 [Guillardia theta]|mmetsp:Transcript_9258/g.30903  ORF Transcript_9258/g.30903 Transcript_9258/m.30903 type:complete len:99 (+) Transcript_9258:3549-3845(+)